MTPAEYEARFQRWLAEELARSETKEEGMSKLQVDGVITIDQPGMPGITLTASASEHWTPLPDDWTFPESEDEALKAALGEVTELQLVCQHEDGTWVRIRMAVAGSTVTESEDTVGLSGNARVLSQEVLTAEEVAQLGLETE